MRPPVYFFYFFFMGELKLTLRGSTSEADTDTTLKVPCMRVSYTIAVAIQYLNDW